tara:strand:+ start:441 stop:1004 length:564 start_codon:yes stop_codon:yes gene_type:complete
MANGKTGRNDAFRRRSRSDRNLRDAIDDAIADAMRDDTGRAMSDSDRDLVNEMIGRKERLAMSMMDESAMRNEIVDPLFASLKGEIGRIKKAPLKPKPRPDIGAIERGNRAARRTAQDLASMEDGGVALSGGQKKLDKNQDGKLSKEDFDILRKEKKNTKVKNMIGGGEVCRGGGAALRGTRFSGTK